MKHHTTLIIVLILSLLYTSVQAQKLEKICVNELVSTHFITSEPIQYVDISTDQIAGDLPVENILRIKPKQTLSEDQVGMVTIVCQKFMVQYVLIPADQKTATKSKFISSKDGFGLLLPEITITAEEMKSISKKVLETEPGKPIQKVRQKGLKMMLNKIFIHGDYYFVDLSIRNHTSIPFEIEQLNFTVRDKKVLKSTNHQEVDINPEYKLYTQQRIQRNYRNVFVFKKFTFPNEKTLEIRLVEKQLSGRTISLQLDYQQILNTEPI